MSEPGPTIAEQAPNPVVVEANVTVHSTLASVYNESEPHFRPENRAKVRARLETLAAETPRERMLDLGCGTGFIIDMTKDLFGSIDGIDATQAMMDRVDLTGGDITLHHGVVENLPFSDNTFDMATAYSFLDHLEDTSMFFVEAARVLKPGGKIYVDLIPNRNFWNGVYAASQAGDADQLDPIVTREIGELVHHEEKLQEQYGIEPKDWRNAEPAKSGGKGFDPVDLAAEVSASGFTNVEIRHEWFLGQAVVHHGDSPESAALIDGHLRRLDPVSSPLFKYLVLTAAKA